jgi:ribosomal protein S18 acetylase RimI-like enzyme
LSALEVRRLEDRDLETLNRDLPLWNRDEYARRLLAQTRLQMVQAIAWDTATAVARGMVLFPEHDEYSDSAAREGCAEVRDVSVAEAFRRRGVATAVMRALEDETRSAGLRRIGLAVGIGDEAAPARALYERLGYRDAHGPFVIGTVLHGDDGPFPVSAAVVYLVKDL